MSPPGPDTLFVVSGGGRGITARCVVELAGRFGGRYLLLGRTDPGAPEPAWSAGASGPAELREAALRARGEHGCPTTPTELERSVAGVVASREVRATLDAVTHAGGRAEYLPVDVTDAVALRRALTPALADGDGDVVLVHGAGVLADRPIGRKTVADYERVVGPKVTGLVNLLACLPEERLRQVVLFSSAAGFFGNPGQSDYALANEVLNKAALLLRRRRPGCRMLVLNWGPWDGGMVTGSLKALFAERDVPLIDPAAGADLLARELARHPGGDVEVVVGRAPAARPSPLGPPAVHRVRRRLDPAANPFLRDHVVDGRRVLPAAVSGSWLVNSAEELLPGLRVVAVRDFRVFNGVVLTDDTPVELTLELTPEAAPVSMGGDDVVLAAKVWSETGSGSRPRYGARLALSPHPPRAPRVDAPPSPVPGAAEGERLYQDGTLFHGPLFRGIRRVLSHDASHIWLECRLPEVPVSAQGQFPVRSVNHFVADVGFQAMLAWVRLHTGMASLPLSCAGSDIYRPLPFDRTFYARAEVRRHDAGSMAADVVLCDAGGRVHLRLTGAEVTVSARLAERFHAVGAPA
ncbi:SDR family NAD(P)-dependent oxidoreductase [Actinoallomurus iriomotensis]|uniref:PKS/mFAS DH domain-containing protein n=1 Tax=Actinoallomurus iriomotensis TaxID=478107 RepID=A0A9W6RUL4_9ACTN|nr:SDR family NAD(P)-dependent oxidoreductase [Actinoallomurus iriomotensis]GLY82110.1 hypothetical protein Airi02_000420 [Actinoallomurus iriomotensis]